MPRSHTTFHKFRGLWQFLQAVINLFLKRNKTKQHNKPTPLKLFSQSLIKSWKYRPNWINPIVPVSLLHSVFQSLVTKMKHDLKEKIFPFCLGIKDLLKQNAFSFWGWLCLHFLSLFICTSPQQCYWLREIDVIWLLQENNIQESTCNLYATVRTQTFWGFSFFPLAVQGIYNILHGWSYPMALACTELWDTCFSLALLQCANLAQDCILLQFPKGTN